MIYPLGLSVKCKTGFYPLMFSLYISVSNGVGREAVINQQPATLSEPFCIFLLMGTGLEIEVSYTVYAALLSPGRIYLPKFDINTI